jgi:predicted methyltransferase
LPQIQETIMRILQTLTAVALLGLQACAPAQNTNEQADREAVRDAIAAAAVGAHRADAHIARNPYRNPVETLDFFGLEPDMTVVELWPGGGWYTEVLAPVLGDGGGALIAASFDPDSDVEYQARFGRAYLEKLAADPDVYGAVETIFFDPPKKARLGDPASADLVVTFRSLHGWISDGISEEVFRSAWEVLRPGGVFGVVQHRAPEGLDANASAESGYVPEAYVVDLAERVGFRLSARSEINANPRDTRDHERGVWTLPPSLALCRPLDEGEERDACVARYREIGESDRMTLKFVKPE